jgi:hypothetical protein
MESSLGQRIKHLRGDARRAAIQRVLKDFSSSAKSRAAFCRDVGIAVVTLGRWEREVEGTSPAKKSATEFVEVSRGGKRGFNLKLPGGIELRVPHDFVERDLQRLLRTLAAAC